MANTLVAAQENALDRTRASVLNEIRNTSTRTMYGKALEDFIAWWNGRGYPALKRTAVQDYLVFLATSGYSSSTVNQRLSAIRRLVLRASIDGVLPIEEALSISRIKGTKKKTVQTGNSLSVQDAEKLMNAPDDETTKGRRDRALLALLVGCGLRRKEIVQLNVGSLQQENSRWILTKVVGPRSRARIVPLPS